MNILHLKECPKCSRLMPYFRSTCDCGYTFNGSERQYRTCPHCGAINPSSKLFCGCGHFILFHHSKLTEADIRDAYQLGVSDGAAQEKKRDEEQWSRFFEDAKLKNTITHKPITSLDDFHEWKAAYDKIKAERERLRNGPPQPAKQKETIYLMEDKDGFLVRVPESKLDAWSKAQAEPPRPLNKAEQQVIDKAVSMLYSDKSSKSDKSQQSCNSETVSESTPSPEKPDKTQTAARAAPGDDKSVTVQIKEANYYLSLALTAIFFVYFLLATRSFIVPSTLFTGFLMLILVVYRIIAAVLVKREKVLQADPGAARVSGSSLYFACLLWYSAYTLYLAYMGYKGFTSGANNRTVAICIYALTAVPALIFTVRENFKARKFASSFEKKLVAAIVAFTISAFFCQFFYTHLPSALIYRIDTEEVESSVTEDERVHVSLTEPYYHREGCPLLEGKSLIEVTLSYAIEKGYAPCDVCYQDT